MHFSSASSANKGCERESESVLNHGSFLPPAPPDDGVRSSRRVYKSIALGREVEPSEDRRQEAENRVFREALSFRYAYTKEKVNCSSKNLSVVAKSFSGNIYIKLKYS